MLSQQTLHILQTGLKHFFDIDPCLTEHLVRNAMAGATIFTQGAAGLLRCCSDRFNDSIAPLVQELRSLRLSNLEL